MRRLWVEEICPDFGTREDFERSMQKAACRWLDTRRRHYGLPAEVELPEYRKAYLLHAPGFEQLEACTTPREAPWIRYIVFRPAEVPFFGKSLKFWAKQRAEGRRL